MGEGRAPHDVGQNSLLEESQPGISRDSKLQGKLPRIERGKPGGQLGVLDEKGKSLALFDKVSMNVGTTHQPRALDARKENDVEADGGLWSICSRCRAG